VRASLGQIGLDLPNCYERKTVCSWWWRPVAAQDADELHLAGRPSAEPWAGDQKAGIVLYGEPPTDLIATW